MDFVVGLHVFHFFRSQITTHAMVKKMAPNWQDKGTIFLITKRRKLSGFMRSDIQSLTNPIARITTTIMTFSFNVFRVQRPE
ncbi:hypothetical protein BVX97_04975 [bacterium E08(2017)]|nr:hypothetical protein BVX97_04975 [bacterium E08(2017)]